MSNQYQDMLLGIARHAEQASSPQPTYAEIQTLLSTLGNLDEKAKLSA
jgi:hypothetical protein